STTMSRELSNNSTFDSADYRKAELRGVVQLSDSASHVRTYKKICLIYLMVKSYILLMWTQE
ncbi:unnamed protein product, partial [Didymodactylos carnosus]